MWWLIYCSSRQKSNNLKINDKYFQNGVTVALNYKETKWNLERVSNIKPFINKYKPEGEHLRKIIQHLLLIFCALKENKYVQLIYKKLIRIAKKKLLLIIPNEETEDWHYRPVKKLSALLREITSKHDDGFYCLNCLYSFRTKNKLKSNEKVYKNEDF